MITVTSLTVVVVIRVVVDLISDVVTEFGFGFWKCRNTLMNTKM